MNGVSMTAVIFLGTTDVILAGGAVVLARAIARNKLAAPAPKQPPKPPQGVSHEPEHPAA